MDTAKGEYLQKILQRALAKKENDSVSDKRPSFRQTADAKNRRQLIPFKVYFGV